MATSYEIRVKSTIGKQLLASFDDMDVAAGPVETVLRGSIIDQAQLYGLLERIQRLDLELIEIRRIGGDSTRGRGS